MFLVDDLLVKPFSSLLGMLQTMALDEMYDTEALQNEIKENRLLYEVGERSAEEYRQQKEELEAQLEIAEQIRSQMRGRMEIKR